MAELQPTETPIVAAVSAATTSAAPPLIEVTATDTDTNAKPNANTNQGPGLAPKRQRRPSVRLGEIGDPVYETHQRRPKTSWRFHKHPTVATKSSKTRPLTNLVNGGDVNDYADDGGNNHQNNSYAGPFDLGNKKPKSNRKPTKKARTNWASSSKFEPPNGGIEGEDAFREENENGAFRDLEHEGSESPAKEQSPVGSMENMGLQSWDRRPSRTRASESGDLLGRGDNMDNGLIHNELESRERSIGVREWLIGLGLGRYAPVFEIHEVDEEVLPMLTLEDLKDMGINAVGSRRKMYAAILKLRKGFS